MAFPPQVAVALADLVLATHLAFIIWVLFGALFTRGRPWLAAMHVLCAIYGVIIELAPWPCPLTLLENWLEIKGGRVPYHGPFLLHYLDAIVYPNVPVALLIWGAAVALAINVVVYARRWRRASGHPGHASPPH